MKAQYPAYAVKSDDGKNQRTNVLAYALKSDDGEKPKKTNSWPML